MKKVLVTGAKGMLGHDLCPSLEDAGFETIETDIDDFDITDIKAVKNYIEKTNPDILIHCAAYTNVDKAEEEPELAEKINGSGTENLAKICAERDITIVYISTDYVFDGTKKGAWEPYDEPKPINQYGLTKYHGEEAIKKYCKKFYITRTSWLYGLHGKNFVETMLSLADKPEIKVVDDQIGCPTWTQELSDGIITLLTEEAPFGIYHVCGSGKTSWYGFAKEIFEIAGLKVNLKPCTTDEFPRPAKRPANSVMYNDNICRTWKAALKDYMKLRGE